MEIQTPTSPLASNAVPDVIGTKVDTVASAAHRATDQMADTASAQVDKLSGSAHRAVDTAAASTQSLAASASELSRQAGALQNQLKESACASIRANPLATVAGALAIGYLAGRIARL
jgi:hypothetical protein